MTIKLTLKQMKELKNNADIILQPNEYYNVPKDVLGNNIYYYANALGGRIRVVEYFTSENGEIKKLIHVYQDYEGIFR